MRIFITLLSILVVLLGCDSQNPSSEKLKKYSFRGFVEGTTYSVSYLSNEESLSQEKFQALIAEFEKSCSIYDSGSLISRINRSETDSIDVAIESCINVAYEINRASGGVYDITIKPLTEAYGFAAKERSVVVNKDSLLQFIGMDKISIKGGVITKRDPRISLDLNSIAKGYSVDLIANFLESQGVCNYIVEIGGEIYAAGQSEKRRDWRVGIDKPIDGNFDSSPGFQSIVEISGKGLATSGNYRRFYTDTLSGKRINHTLNPKNGESSINNMLSATILADNCMEADGYATACMALGFEQAKEMIERDTSLYALLIYEQNGVLKSYVTQNLQPMIIELEN